MTNNTTLLPPKNALLKVNLNRGQIKLIAWPNYNFFFRTVHYLDLDSI